MLHLSSNDLVEVFANCMSWQTADGAFQESCVNLPATLGQGFVRSIRIDADMHLLLSDQRYSDAVQIDTPEENWPLEFIFTHGGGIHASIDGLVDSSNFGDHAAIIYMPSLKARLKFAAKQRNESISVKLSPAYVLSWLQDDSPASASILNALRRQHPVFFQRPLGAEFQVALTQLLYCTYSGVARQLYLKSKALELVALLLKTLSGEATAAGYLRDADMKKLRQAHTIITANPANPPRLKELANQVGLNDFKLKIGFKSLFGTTVFGYVREQRMEQARMLLQASNASVTQVAMEVGYSSTGHFVEVFKLRFGVTPGRFLSASRRSRINTFIK